MPFLDYTVIKTLFSKNIQWPVEILLSRETDTARPLLYRIPISYSMCVGGKYRLESGPSGGPRWLCLLFLFFFTVFFTSFLSHVLPSELDTKAV